MGPGAMTQVMQLTKNLSTSLVVILTIVLFGCGGTSDDAESLNLPITPASGSYAVAIDGDIIVIGAEVDSVDGEDAGGAYIYRFNGIDWIGQGRISPSAPTLDAQFGADVAVDSNEEVVVVATLEDAGGMLGSVYVFRFDMGLWVEEQRLVPNDAADADVFTTAIAIDGDEIVVGARDDATGVGHVYVYRFDGDDWLHEQTLTASDPDAAKFFGSSLDLDGDVLVVGAWGSEEAGVESGSAYVFRFDALEYVEEQLLTASDAAAFDAFGVSLGVDGDAIVIGAQRDDDDGVETGSAYVFRFVTDTWVEEQKLTAADPEVRQRFGSAVDIHGDVVAIGAELANGAGLQDAFAGAAYVFRFDGMDWIEEQRISDGGRVDGELFGTSIAIDSDAIVAGTFDDLNFGFAFRFVDPNWIEEAVLEEL